MSQTDTSQPLVTVYSTPTCGFCKTEKQYLDNLGVKYIAKDIEQDPSAMKELMEKTKGDFSGVPVTDIDGELILGFNRPQIDTLLREKGLLS